MTTEKRVVSIVLTGGPCSGKTTAVDWIKEDVESKGWKVVFVPEVATEILFAGININTCGSPEAFQHCVSNMQAAKEILYRDFASKLLAEKVLIVFDRGIMDGRAYIDAEDFHQLLAEIGLTEEEARNRYDAVFHLVTAAIGALEFYTTSNNKARTETPEQAAELDHRIIEGWSGHKHHRIIDNSSDFNDKMRRLLDEITIVLNEAEQE